MSSTNKVQTLKPKEKVLEDDSGNKNFEWSFKFVIWWMRMWGFRLDLTNTRIGKVGRATLRGWSIFVLVFNIAANGFSLYSTIMLLLDPVKDHRDAKGIDKEATPAALVNIGMEQSFFISFMLGDHVIFFVVSLTTWKKLWNFLMQIEEKLKLPYKFYRDCRIASLVGFVLLVLVSTQLD